MNNFFESEVVQKEMRDIYDSYRRLEVLRKDLPNMEEDEKTKHVQDVKDLIERQKIFYVRLSLTANDDSEIMEIKERMDMLAKLMGFPNYIGSLDAMIKILDGLLTEPPK